MENWGKPCACHGRMHVRAHVPKNVNVRKREKTGRADVLQKTGAHHGKQGKTMCVAWTDSRTGRRGKKREPEGTGKNGVRRPCCIKQGARHGKRVKTMCVAWKDARTGTRAKKREREETGKTGTGPCCKKLGAPWKTGENLVRGMDGCTYGHTGQKT